MRNADLKAVFFDVDFTLIHPRPIFRGEGYREFAARYGMTLDALEFERAVASAAPLLDGPDERYDDEVFVSYTAHIIERMGGSGAQVDPCAREIYREWAACRHFEMYDDVPPARGVFSGRAGQEIDVTVTIRRQSGVLDPARPVTSQRLRPDLGMTMQQQ